MTVVQRRSHCSGRMTSHAWEIWEEQSEVWEATGALALKVVLP